MIMNKKNRLPLSWILRLTSLIFIPFFALCLCSCYSDKKEDPVHIYQPKGTPKLAVIGVGNQVKKKAWQDLRIGFGLHGMLTEGLYNTGLFQMQEEKREILNQLGQSTERLWNNEVIYSAEELNKIANTLNVDVVAYATVISYKTPVSGMKLGVVSRTRTVAHINIKICLFDVLSQQLICSTGKGSADAVSDGLFVEFKDDGRLSTKSLIGKASKQAIDNALNKLISNS